MKDLSEAIGLILAGILVIGATALLMALPTMWLWNSCLVPAVEGINSISFLQALGINLLFSILFKSSSAKGKKND